MLLMCASRTQSDTKETETERERKLKKNREMQSIVTEWVVRCAMYSAQTQ